MTDYRDLLEHLYGRRYDPPEREYFTLQLKEELAQLQNNPTIGKDTAAFLSALGLLLDRYMTPATLFLQAKITASTLQNGECSKIPQFESVSGKSDAFYRHLLSGLPGLLKHLGHDELAYEVGRLVEGVYTARGNPDIHGLQTFVIRKDFITQPTDTLEAKIARDALADLGETTTPFGLCMAVFRTAYSNAFPDNELPAGQQGIGCENARPLPPKYVKAMENVLGLSTEIGGRDFGNAVAVIAPDFLRQVRRE